jgi:hypothetical protein
MSSRTRLAAALLAGSAAAAVAGDGDAAKPAPLRFGWTVPTRVGVTELDDDTLQMHYVVVLDRAADSKLRVRCEDLRLTEYAGRSADKPEIAPRLKILQAFVAGKRPEVVLDADARAVDAPDAVQHFADAVNEVAKFEDVDVARAVPVLRKQVDALRADAVLAQSFQDQAAAPWRWAVGTWVGLPARPGTVFEGDLEFASAIDGVTTSTMSATIDATPVAGAAGRWQFTLLASSDGDRAKTSLSHGELAKAAQAKRSVELVAVIDADSLRPRHVTYKESLEATMPGDEYPHHARATRTLDFEWEPPKPPTAPSAEDTRAVDATASASMEAWRVGDAAKLLELAPPSLRRSDREMKVERWPEGWSWKPFRRRIDGDWALAAVNLKRGEEGEQVWPLLLHREAGAWYVLGQGFAPAETGLITHAMEPPAPRWMEPQLEDWTVEAMTIDPAAEIVLGAPPRAFTFAAGRGRALWFKLTTAHTVEIRAESTEDVTPCVELVMASGVIHPTRSGTKRRHVATHTLRPGTYGFAVGVEEAGTVMVSLSDASMSDLALRSPAGPRQVRAGEPARFRLRLPSPRDVIFRVVPVAGRKGDAEVVLSTEAGSTMQSNRSGVVQCSAVNDVVVSVATLGEGEAECFLVAEEVETPHDAPAPLRIGESRDIDVPVDAAVLVRVDAPGGAAWTSTLTSDAGTAIAGGEFHDERGGGVIVASRGAPIHVRVRVDSAK